MGILIPAHIVFGNSLAILQASDINIQKMWSPNMTIDVYQHDHVNSVSISDGESKRKQPEKWLLTTVLE